MWDVNVKKCKCKNYKNFSQKHLAHCPAKDSNKQVDDNSEVLEIKPQGVVMVTWDEV